MACINVVICAALFGISMAEQCSTEGCTTGTKNIDGEEVCVAEHSWFHKETPGCARGEVKVYGARDVAGFGGTGYHCCVDDVSDVAGDNIGIIILIVGIVCIFLIVLCILLAIRYKRNQENRGQPPVAAAVQQPPVAAAVQPSV